MVKRCSVCNHPSRPEIDRALQARASYRSLAGEFNLSTSALCRHRRHLSRQLDLESRRQAQTRQADLLERLEVLNARLDRLFNSAADYHSLHVPLGCIRESLRLLSLLERVRHGPLNQPE